MVWSNQFTRSKNSIYCVAASDYYAEEDYIRNWKEFSSFKVLKLRVSFLNKIKSIVYIKMH